MNVDYPPPPRSSGGSRDPPGAPARDPPRGDDRQTTTEEHVRGARIRPPRALTPMARIRRRAPPLLRFCKSFHEALVEFFDRAPII